MKALELGLVDTAIDAEELQKATEGLTAAQMEADEILRTLGPDSAAYAAALEKVQATEIAESLGAIEVTRIIAAHRLSTARGADRIYVIDKGKVAQEGSFEELSAEGGLFARLMTRQQS